MKRILITLLVIVSILQNSFARESNLNSKNSITFSSNFQYYEIPAITYSRIFWKNNWLKIGLNNFGTHVFSDGVNYADGELFISGYERSETNIYSTFSIGIENRKKLKEKIELEIGGDILIRNGFRRINNDDPNKPARLRTNFDVAFEYGFDLNLGFFYKISNNFLVGSRLTPYVIINFKDPIDEDYSLEYDLTNLSFLCLRYRF